MWTEIKADGKSQNNEWRIKQNTLTNGQDVARLKNEMSEKFCDTKKRHQETENGNIESQKENVNIFIKIRKTNTVQKLIHLCF